MARKDTLAAGARSAKFMGGSGENDIFRNVSSEPRVDPVITPDDAPKSYQIFAPLNGVLLIRQKVAEKASKLVVVETTQERPSEGFVVAAGANALVNEGDQVVFGKYAGTEFKLNGEVLLLMKVEDILGKISTVSPAPVKTSRFDRKKA